MAAKMETKGFEELRRKTEALVGSLDRELVKWGMGVGLIIVRRSKKRYFRRVNKTASPRPPILTSRHGGAGLKGSIGATSKLKRNLLDVRVGVERQKTGAKYGRRHEKGDWPFLEPAKKDSAGQAERWIRGRLWEKINRAKL